MASNYHDDPTNPNCGACEGDGGENFDCHRCGGSGQDPDFGKEPLNTETAELRGDAPLMNAASSTADATPADCIADRFAEEITDDGFTAKKWFEVVVDAAKAAGGTYVETDDEGVLTGEVTFQDGSAAWLQDSFAGTLVKTIRDADPEPAAASSTSGAPLETVDASATPSSAFDAVMEPETGQCIIPAPIWDPSIAEYHEHWAVSSSSLRTFLDDPGQYYRERIKGEKRKAPTATAKRAFLVGSAFGGYFLDRRDYDAALPGLKPEDLKKLEAMIASIEGAGLDTWAGQLRRYLTTPAGRSEWSYLFTDDASGMPCRIRCDRLVGWGGDAPRILNIEVKTSREVDPYGFRRAIKQFGYYRQLALQEQGLRRAFPWAEIESRWAFVSTVYPYRVAIMQPRPDAIAAAEENGRLLLELADMVNTKPNETWGPRRHAWEMSGEPLEA